METVATRLTAPISVLAADIEAGNVTVQARTCAAVRRLARIPEDYWTPAVRAAASKAVALVDPTQRIEPEAPGDALSETRAAWRRTADPTIRAAVIDGRWHIRAARGTPAALHAMAVPGAVVDGEITAIPEDAWAAELIVAHIIYVKPDYDDALDRALALTPPPQVTMADDQIQIRVGSSPELADDLKSARCRWDSRQLFWHVPASDSRQLAAVIDKWSLRSTTDASDAISAKASAWNLALEASVALDAPELIVPGLNPEITLRPFQRGGIAYMAAKRRTSNCDSPGLGKSVQALATFAVTGSLPAVVVTKAGLKSNWALREIPKAFPSWTTVVVDGRKAVPIEPADVIVVNYDVLASRVNDLLALRPKGVAFDESHYLKTATSARSKAGVALARAIGLGEGDHDMPGGGVVLNLTATPRPNRNYELWSQIRALGHDDLFGSSRGFAMKFCGAKEYRVKGKKGGTRTQIRVHEEPVPPERDLELNELLRAHCMVVRHKNDVLADLPPLELLPVVVDPDKKGHKEYERAKADIKAYAMARARQIAEEEGEPPGPAAWRARLAVESNPDLVELGNLRRIADTMKVPGVLSFTTGLLTDNPVDPDTGKPMKVLVFAHYRDVQAVYAEQTEPALRKELNKTGSDLGLSDDLPAVEWLRSAADQKRSEQDSIVDRFQSDPSLRVLICSASAIAEGITLTEAGAVVLAHTPYTWAQIEQQAGRAYGRLNDAHGIGLWAPYVPESIDEAVLGIVERKRAASERVVQGLPVGFDDDEASVAAELFAGLASDKG